MKLAQLGVGIENTQRLAAVHRLNLLDAPPEPAFERLTRLVQRVLHVPIALISLIDEKRQFFIGATGLPEPWATTREMPLSFSCCSSVVETGEIVVVNDTLQRSLLHTTFGQNLFAMRSYIAGPLVTSDGMVVGALCAIDKRPRIWNNDDIQVLSDLAASVVAEIERRRDALAREEAATALHESTSRFAGAFEYATIGMALVGTDGRWLQVNHSLCELLGYTEQELLAISFQNVTHKDDLAIDLSYLNKMLSGSTATYHTEKRYIHKTGHIIWILLNVSLVRDLQGQPQYFVAQIQDISSRRKHERERHELIEQLKAALSDRDALLQQSSETLARTQALYEVSHALNHTQEMQAILQTVVESAAKVLPANRAVIIMVDRATRNVSRLVEAGPGLMQIEPLSFAELWDGLSGLVLRNGQPVLSLKQKSDSRESFAVQMRRIRDNAGSIMVAPVQSQGSVFGTITTINTPDEPDFTPADLELLATLANQAAIAIERATLLTELQHQANIDGLTQLLNRRSWFDQSQRIVQLAERYKRPVSVAILDVDHFKHINDTYGHLIGDIVLQLIAQQVRTMVRRSDLLGRYGGEEFVIMLPESNQQVAFSFAERICQRISAMPFTIAQHTIRLTVSLGVASIQASEIDLLALLEKADQALYQAKQQGRNRAYAANS